MRYEFHQPPLYYALAAPLYRAGQDLDDRQHVRLLRLFSLAWGGVLVLITYALVGRLFPERPWLAVAATAFVGFLPMHLAMTASLNNDVLAEIVLVLVLCYALRLVQRGLTRRETVALGALLGLGVLTKTTTLIGLPLVAAAHLAAELQPGRGRERRWSRALRGTAMAYLVAAAVGGWFLVRNSLVYGQTDIFGWRRHDAIVTGQPTTLWWIETYGLDHLVQRFLGFTFRSFWGVFGWLGIFMDERIYRALGVLTGLALLGLLFFAYRHTLHPYRLNRLQRLALALFALSLLLTFGSYAWYNLKFVQHQGRYLFSSILPIALFFTLGLAELLPPRLERPALYLFSLGLAALSLVSLNYL